MSAPSGIREWLKALGLDEYAELFERERIDLEAARHLSELDLRELGLPLGPRAKLKIAIRQLASPAARHEEPSIRDSEPIPTRAPARGAERRQLTVMFCDLVGSTGLAERHDPEELRDLMRAYQQACGESVLRFEGHVAQYLGDGLMVYFGWPKAHEDDAERAIRSALDIVRAVKRVPAPSSELQVRIGISTGQVVVGETGGGDASVPKMAVGETPNLASRMQGLAGPDEIIIAPTTRRLIGATFRLDDLGEHALRGIVGAVRAFRVRGESSAEDRFAASRGTAMSALVGRDSELALLAERWQQAVDGEGQVVVISGEPGIGKSRILRALRARIEGPIHFVRYQCSPFFANTAFYPVIEQLKREAALLDDESRDEKLRKIEATLERTGGRDSEAIALHAALLSLPGDGSVAPIDRDARQQKERTIEVIAEQLLRAVAARPGLVVFEDVHWIDPTTHELIDHLITRIVSARVLLVIIHRPEFKPPWAAHAHVTLHSLNRLTKRQCATLVTGLSSKRLPDALIAQIVAKTDGVPLFIEEVTKAVLDSGVLVDAGERYELPGTLESMRIPETLHDSLMARLDRDLPVKEIAQIGAVIGREFGYELLDSISPLQEPALCQALESLVRSDLIHQRGIPPNAVYVFKHALVQDAAYDSLLKRRRAEVHERIAEALEAGIRNADRTEPEVIAHHFSAAGLGARALRHWVQAGRNAMQRAAYREAAAHLARGVEIVRAAGPGLARDRDESELLVEFGQAQLRGGESQLAMQAFEKAAALARKLEATELLAHAALGFAEACWRQGLPDPTPVSLLEQASAALGDEESALKVKVLAWLSIASALTGATAEADRVAEAAAAMATRLGIAAMVAKTLYMRAAQLSGQWNPIEVTSKLIRAREATGGKRAISPDEFCEVMSYECVTLASLGDLQGAVAALDELAAAAEKQRQPFYLYYVTSSRSAIALFEGRYEDSEALAKQALTIGDNLAGFDVAGLYGVQMFSLRREQGRLGEVAPLLRQFVQTALIGSTWGPGLTLAYAELDMLDEARTEFERLARGEFQAVPKDSSWLNCIAMLAEACHKLGDERSAEVLYRLMLPYSTCNVVAPPLVACYGAAARHLGLLASTMRQWESAQSHFESALAANARQGGQPLVAHTQFAYAAMLLASGRSEQRDRARMLAAEAVSTARHLGMSALITRAAALQERCSN